MQRFLIYLFIFKDALHVSGSSSANHQEHTAVHTASSTVKFNDRVRLLINLYTKSQDVLS